MPPSNTPCADVCTPAKAEPKALPYPPFPATPPIDNEHKVVICWTVIVAREKAQLEALTDHAVDVYLTSANQPLRDALSAAILFTELELEKSLRTLAEAEHALQSAAEVQS